MDDNITPEATPEPTPDAAPAVEAPGSGSAASATTTAIRVVGLSPASVGRLVAAAHIEVVGPAEAAGEGDAPAPTADLVLVAADTPVAEIRRLSAAAAPVVVVAGPSTPTSVTVAALAAGACAVVAEGAERDALAVLADDAEAVRADVTRHHLARHLSPVVDDTVTAVIVAQMAVSAGPLAWLARARALAAWRGIAGAVAGEVHVTGDADLTILLHGDAARDAVVVARRLVEGATGVLAAADASAPVAAGVATAADATTPSGIERLAREACVRALLRGGGTVVVGLDTVSVAAETAVAALTALAATVDAARGTEGRSVLAARTAAHLAGQLGADAGATSLATHLAEVSIAASDAEGEPSEDAVRASSATLVRAAAGASVAEIISGTGTERRLETAILTVAHAYASAVVGGTAPRDAVRALQSDEEGGYDAAVLGALDRHVAAEEPAQVVGAA